MASHTPIVLPGIVTIDQDNDYAGELDVIRHCNPSFLRHPDFTTAFGNVLGRQGQAAGICGIGQEGMFFTGGGGRDTAAGHVVSNNTRKQWRTVINSITPTVAGPISGLTIYCCDTGAGTEGSELVFAMAKMIGATVAAPTGAIMSNSNCGGLCLEAGARWQTSTPDDEKPPTPIPSPSPKLGNEPATRIYIPGFLLPLSTSAISSIEFFSRDSTQDARWTWGDQSLPFVLSYINFDQPHEGKMMPLARITGMLIVNFRIADEEFQRVFRVLNHRLLQDAVTLSTYYYFNHAQMIAASR